MREIPVTGSDRPAIVDDADYEALASHNWYAQPSGHAVTAGKYTRERGRTETLYMHRIIMSAPRGVQVDHKNNDPLDNRRANLRLSTHGQNMHNRGRRCKYSACPFKGVSLHRANRGPDGWAAAIQKDKRRRYLGWFRTPAEAAIAYDAAAVELHGEFSCINGILPEHRAKANRCLLTPEDAFAVRMGAA